MLVSWHKVSFKGSKNLYRLEFYNCIFLLAQVTNI